MADLLTGKDITTAKAKAETVQLTPTFKLLRCACGRLLCKAHCAGIIEAVCKRCGKRLRFYMDTQGVFYEVVSPPHLVSED